MVEHPSADLLEVGLGTLSQTPGVHQEALGLGDHTAYSLRRIALRLQLRQLHGLLDQGKLVVGVVDGIVGRQADGLPFPAQQ